MAASVLAGLVAADAPAVDESVGPGPFRRRKGASMHKKSSPAKGAAMPYGQPVRLHLDTPAPWPSQPHARVARRVLPPRVRRLLLPIHR
jgi:hypothetical protein